MRNYQPRENRNPTGNGRNRIDSSFGSSEDGTMNPFMFWNPRFWYKMWSPRQIQRNMRFWQRMWNPMFFPNQSFRNLPSDYGSYSQQYPLENEQYIETNAGYRPNRYNDNYGPYRREPEGRYSVYNQELPEQSINRNLQSTSSTQPQLSAQSYNRNQRQPSLGTASVQQLTDSRTQERPAGSVVFYSDTPTTRLDTTSTPSLVRSTEPTGTVIQTQPVTSR